MTRGVLVGVVALAASIAGAEQSPTPVSDFSVSHASSGWVIQWKTPAEPGLKVVVAARTDGFPRNPTDGEVLAERFDPTGTLVTTAYDPIANGDTYYYSAFSIDDVGRISSPARAQATVPLAPPGVVKNLRRTDGGGSLR